MKRLSTYQLLAVYVVLYTLLVMFMKPNPTTLAAYQLNGLSYRVLLMIASALPAFLTWFAAYYGYEQLREYNVLLKNTKEGKAFNSITRGLKWISLYLPAVALFGLSLSAISNIYPGFRSFSLILSGYAAVVVAVIAFTYLNTGSRLLAQTQKARPTLLKIRIMSLGFIALSVFYCAFVTVHSIGDKLSYHMPLILLLFTVVIPFFYAWYLGVHAVLDINAYATKVPGLLYRKALNRLSAGLLTVILSSILIQYVNSANTERGRLVLGSVLVMRYVLFIFLAAGFALIANSAKKLQQIEKI